MSQAAKWTGYALALFVSLSVVPGVADAQRRPAQSATDSETDPLNGDRRLPDDEIAVSYTASNGLANRVYYPDDKLDLGSASLTGSGSSPDADTNIATATGKMHTTQNDEYFSAYLVGGQVVVESWDPSGNTHYGPVAFPSLLPQDAKVLKIAAGDFNGDSIDELAIAFEDSNDTLSLAILQMTDAGFALVQHIVDTSFYLKGTEIVDFDLAVGDLDGDGTDEILVVCGDDAPGFVPWYYVAVRLYDVAPSFAITYKSRSQISSQAWDALPQNKAIAVGRFDTVPGDDIIAANIEIQSTENPTDNFQFRIVTLGVDSNLNLVQKGSMTSQWRIGGTDSTAVHLATGDLDWDGTDEAVLVWSEGLWNGESPFDIWVLDIDTSLGIHHTLGQGEAIVTIYGNEYANVAVGNFDGKSDFASEIAVAWEGPSSQGQVQIFDVSSDLVTLTAKGSDGGFALASGKRITLVSGDFDGDGLILGEPIHWVIENHSQPSLVLAEPPKHIDYIKDSDGNLGELNVSRTWNSNGNHFNSEMQDEAQTEITNSNTSTSSIDYGVSVSASVSDDYEVPVLGGVGVSLDGTVGYEYSKHEQDMNQNYTGVDLGLGLQADNDDYVMAKIMDIDIWRYPVVGHIVDGMNLLFGLDLTSQMQDELNSGQTPQELVDAFQAHGEPLSGGETVSTQPYGWKLDDAGNTYLLSADAGKLVVNEKTGKSGPLYIQISHPTNGSNGSLEGRTIEWYQPVHENGNIFSYPWSSDLISDLEKGTLLTQVETLATGGGEAQTFVTWKDATTQDKQVETDHKLSEDSSFTLTGKILDAETSVTVKDTYDKSWSNLTDSTTALSQSQGITISKPDLNDSYSYNFSSFIYSTGVTDVTQNGSTVQMPVGTLKVDFTVDPSSTTAAEWWLSLSGYGDHPDLSLNHPFRWVSNDNGISWQSNGGAYNFQMMKGLFLLDAAGRQFGYYATDGDKVTVRARVYNYSFVDAQDVDVTFAYQDSDDNKTWSPDTPIVIGTDTLPTLWGFQNSQGQPNWSLASTTFDTTGLAGKYIRFWVFLDPDNKIAEVTGHDTGETYDNNEGYFPLGLAVVPPDSLGNMAGPNVVAGDQLYFDDAKVRRGDATRVHLNVSADADKGNVGHVLVSFYDGNPNRRGKLFDMELIPFVYAGQSLEVSVPYPTSGKRLGRHHIYAVIRSKYGETNVDDNVATGSIMVKPAWKGIAKSILGFAHWPRQ